MDWTNTNKKQTPSFLTEVLSPTKQSYSLEILTFGQVKLEAGSFKNRYSRYSYEGHRRRQDIIHRIKNKESLRPVELGGQYEYQIQSDTFVSVEMSTRSSINFNVFEKIEKEVLPVKETKASMGRKKRITQNQIKKCQKPFIDLKLRSRFV